MKFDKELKKEIKKDYMNKNMPKENYLRVVVLAFFAIMLILFFNNIKNIEYRFYAFMYIAFAYTRTFEMLVCHYIKRFYYSLKFEKAMKRCEEFDSMYVSKKEDE